MTKQFYFILIDNRTKEYRYDREHFIGEGSHEEACQKLKEHRN